MSQEEFKYPNNVISLRNYLLSEISKDLQEDGLDNYDWIELLSNNVALDFILELLSCILSKDKNNLFDCISLARTNSPITDLDDIGFALDYAQKLTGPSFTKKLRQELLPYLATR